MIYFLIVDKRTARGELGAPKIAIFKILKCTKVAKQIPFRTRRCQKYAEYQKTLQISVQYSISYIKVSGLIYLSPPWEGSQGAPKIAIFEILNCMKMVKQIHIRTRRCQKYALYQKRLQIRVFAHCKLSQASPRDAKLSQTGPSECSFTVGTEPIFSSWGFNSILRRQFFFFLSTGVIFDVVATLKDQFEM